MTSFETSLMLDGRLPNLSCKRRLHDFSGKDDGLGKSAVSQYIFSHVCADQKPEQAGDVEARREKIVGNMNEALKVLNYHDEDFGSDDVEQDYVIAINDLLPEQQEEAGKRDDSSFRREFRMDNMSMLSTELSKLRMEGDDFSESSCEDEDDIYFGF